jgi:hypothetical protein
MNLCALCGKKGRSKGQKSYQDLKTPLRPLRINLCALCGKKGRSKEQETQLKA